MLYLSYKYFEKLIEWDENYLSCKCLQSETQLIDCFENMPIRMTSFETVCEISIVKSDRRVIDELYGREIFLNVACKQLIAINETYINT